MVSQSSGNLPVASESAPETAPRPTPSGDVGLLDRPAEETPWHVIVWNDPVNLMSYVTYVFRSYFQYSEARARTLMMAVHSEGKAVVFTGGREEAERHTSAMHGYGLWATFGKDGE